jgi:hypothetical protein
MTDIDKILERISVIGNPVFLLKMLNDINRLMKEHRESYPIGDKCRDLYLIVGERYYKILKKEFVISKDLPSEACIVRLSHSDLRKVGNIVGVKNRKDEINEIYTQLRRIKNIKQYNIIIEAVRPSFSTNLSMAQLATIVVEQVVENKS